jgi:hypothetical protein
MKYIMHGDYYHTTPKINGIHHEFIQFLILFGMNLASLSFVANANNTLNLKNIYDSEVSFKDIYISSNHQVLVGNYTIQNDEYLDLQDVPVYIKNIPLLCNDPCAVYITEQLRLINKNPDLKKPIFQHMVLLGFFYNASKIYSSSSINNAAEGNTDEANINNTNSTKYNTLARNILSLFKLSPSQMEMIIELLDNLEQQTNDKNALPEFNINNTQSIINFLNFSKEIDNDSDSDNDNNNDDNNNAFVHRRANGELYIEIGNTSFTYDNHDHDEFKKNIKDVDNYRGSGIKRMHTTNGTLLNLNNKCLSKNDNKNDDCIDFLIQNITGVSIIDEQNIKKLDPYTVIKLLRNIGFENANSNSSDSENKKSKSQLESYEEWLKKRSATVQTDLSNPNNVPVVTYIQLLLKYIKRNPAVIDHSNRSEKLVRTHNSLGIPYRTDYDDVFQMPLRMVNPQPLIQKIHRQMGGGLIQMQVPILPGLPLNRNLGIMYTPPSQINRLVQKQRQINRNNLADGYRQSFDTLLRNANVNTTVKDVIDKRINKLDDAQKSVEKLLSKRKKIAFIRHTWKELADRMDKVGENRVLKESLHLLDDDLNNNDLSKKFNEKYTKYIARINKCERDLEKMFAKIQNIVN